MKASIQYFNVTDIESKNPSMSNNGGDYYSGRTIAVNVDTGTPLAVSYWTSADFDYCPVCGTFTRVDEEHCGRWHSPRDRAPQSAGNGWENGRKSSARHNWRNPDEFTIIGNK